jgi:peptidoglycan hydrolase-like protein with peptidoglycan-binding domain
MSLSHHAKIPALAVSILLTASLAFAGTTPKKHSTAKTPSAKVRKTSHHSSKKSRKPRGQQAIDNGRTREIQEALVREHYLSGETSGTWDASTQAAMRKYQADQGWQSKQVPDSRALIRLGLGPNHDHLLNPESAMVSSAALRPARPTSSRTTGNAVVLPVRSQGTSTAVSAGDLSTSR